MERRRDTAARRLMDGGLILGGAVLMGVGTHVFMEPAQIAPGGAMGLALLLNHLTELPVGALTLAFNVPLLILAWCYLSHRFAVTTAVVSTVCSAVLDLAVTPFCPVYAGDRLLSSLYGGILVGAGMALVFLTGTTTGGTDIVGYLLQKKRPHISIGRALLMVDGVILFLSIFVFGNIEAALFGMVALYAQTKTIDSIIYGGDTGSMATVITGKPERIAERVIRELDRSATLIPAKGAYSKKDTCMLICTVRRSQFGKLKRIVSEEDPKAFVMATDTSEVLGEGFGDLAK
ncbi:MAG: YitT family protein [Otoolea sp.]|nr:YitT family protein [Clostridiaceae bacterium]MDD6074131.1 YitT family protein [Clostridium sp.]MDY5484904.1 YitT family protein [Clostridium sp.]